MYVWYNSYKNKGKWMYFSIKTLDMYMIYADLRSGVNNLSYLKQTGHF